MPASVRFAAYNDYYGIRHQRFNDIDYAHVVSKIYEADDQREDDLVLAPNPATDVVRLYSRTDDPITRVIILRSDASAVAIVDKVLVDVTSYPAGTYYVSVITSSSKTAAEVLVVRR